LLKGMHVQHVNSIICACLSLLYAK
jgi:hypothetical protein